VLWTGGASQGADSHAHAETEEELLFCDFVLGLLSPNSNSLLVRSGERVCVSVCMCVRCGRASVRSHRERRKFLRSQCPTLLLVGRERPERLKVDAWVAAIRSERFAYYSDNRQRLNVN
jgi:hypothetical protein